MTTWTFGISEIRAHLYQLVVLADFGVDVVITRHRKPVARLLAGDPLGSTDQEQLRKARAALRKIRGRLARRGRPLAEELVPPLLRAVKARR